MTSCANLVVFSFYSFTHPLKPFLRSFIHSFISVFFTLVVILFFFFFAALSLSFIRSSLEHWIDDLDFHPWYLCDVAQHQSNEHSNIKIQRNSHRTVWKGERKVRGTRKRHSIFLFARTHSFNIAKMYVLMLVVKTYFYRVISLLIREHIFWA